MLLPLRGLTPCALSELRGKSIGNPNARAARGARLPPKSFQPTNKISVCAHCAHPTIYKDAIVSGNVLSKSLDRFDTNRFALGFPFTMLWLCSGCGRCRFRLPDPPLNCPPSAPSRPLTPCSWLALQLLRFDRILLGLLSLRLLRSCSSTEPMLSTILTNERYCRSSASRRSVSLAVACFS